MRNCGSCTLCCTLTYVPELGKPERVTCEHCDRGCRIYEGRPESCKQYACAWLTGDMSEDMRPDKAGFIAEVYPRMVAIILRDGISLSDLPVKALDEISGYTDAGKLAVATGMHMKLPKGMSPIEARGILMNTLREYGHGGS